MKRGFLNTPRSKKVIEDAYEPQPPSQAAPEPSRERDQKAPFAMKRGFLNTSQEKRTLQEVYRPHSPPGPEPSRQGRPSPASHSGPEKERGAAAVEDAMDVDVSGAENPPSVQQATDDDAETKAETACKDPKGKGKQRAVDEEIKEYVSFIPPRPTPGPPGWGRHPDEHMLHKIPEVCNGGGRKRAIFRVWPRDPNGKALEPNDGPRGTMSPDGYPWGATLYDLYHVYRLPSVKNFVSIVTGSMMSEVMKEIGELDAAEPEIEWAKSEGKPRIEGVADTAELIRCAEFQYLLGVHDHVSMHEDVRKMASKERSEKEDEMGEGGEHNSKNDKEDKAESMDTEAGPASVPPPSTISVTSPFHPSHYPKPWPFIPFEDPPPVLLQERIPLYLLPQRLYVHDPFNLLPAREQGFYDTSWTSRLDVVHTYNIELSESVCKDVKEARRKAEELEEFKARTLVVLRFQRTKEQIRNHEPMIEVPLPPYVRRVTKVEESHLYLSPEARVGEGNHSIVYKGEWELPRDLFIQPMPCDTCLKESLEKEIVKLKDTGRWEKMLNAVGWGPAGLTGGRPTKAELDEVNDPINLEQDGEIIERELICVVPHTGLASRKLFQVLNESAIWDQFMERKTQNSAVINLVADCGSVLETAYAPTIRVNAPFSHEGQKPCTHNANRHNVPRTAKFTVIAKLSLQYDDHLPKEAKNYQQFPEHFFHHYNGYTIHSQLHTIVPVNAVVPQFYGYYTPEVTKEEPEQGKRKYLSPILLLEHCGRPIEPEELAGEDQEECASLYLRFQNAGWLHQSVAQRNFLVQYGKPTEFPTVRASNPEPSFRLVDFGRSERCAEVVPEKQREEWAVLRMFPRLVGMMATTIR